MNQESSDGTSPPGDTVNTSSTSSSAAYPVTSSGSADSASTMPARSKPSIPAGLVTVGPHRSARAMIMQAVDMLETENDELRRQNSAMLDEVGRLRQENDQLRHRLEQNVHAHASLQTQNEALREDHKHALHELDNERAKRQKTEQLAAKLERENAQHLANIESLRKDVTERSTEVDKMTKELEVVRDRLVGNEKFLSDRDVELFHQVSRLREEKRSLQLEKEQNDKLTHNLQLGVTQLQAQLQDSSAELKNENRRHALLAREFNSLLEENNQLKQQLRKRRGSVNFPAVSSSPRVEREDTVIMLQRESTRSKMTVSLDNLSSIGRETSDDNASTVSRTRRSSVRDNKRQLLTGSLLRDSKGMRTLEQLVSGSQVMDQQASVSRDRDRGERYLPDARGSSMSDSVLATRRKPQSGGSTDSNNSNVPDVRDGTPKENRRQLAPAKVSTTTSVGSSSGQINASLVAGPSGGNNNHPATGNLFANVAATPKIVSSSVTSQNVGGRRGSNSPPNISRSNTDILPSVPHLSKTWRP